MCVNMNGLSGCQVSPEVKHGMHLVVVSSVCVCVCVCVWVGRGQGVVSLPTAPVAWNKSSVVERSCDCVCVCSTLVM